ncbi:MAG: hypothetical protein M3Q62_09805 [Actinomycetota bacterium]|nr:hypothetical protein [Rubrobacteraceae bacterium]MDQ3183814.1 hypothetical protein [Actinomycetota bacterium]MDQ3496915.1 hypothetical protein [Actinomycetota bacterium]
MPNARVTDTAQSATSSKRRATFSKRRFIRRDGSARERGPYWYFQFYEGGKRKKLYLGKTSDPESTLVTKRAKPPEE